MALKPEISIPAALATATIVYSTYNRMPSAADIRVTQAGDDTLETVRKQNAWFAAATVGAVSLIAKDPVIFIVGGAMVIGLDWVTRANIWTSPASGKVVTPGEGGSVQTPKTPVATVTEMSYAESPGYIA